MSGVDLSELTLSDGALAAFIIQNALDYAIFTLDETGQITHWSRGAERVIGYTPDEAVGQNFSVLFTESDLAADADKKEITGALETGRAEDSRWHVRRSGEVFWASGATMRLQGQGPVALVKFLRDETAAKLAEEQRILLLNELNHRVKNTLATVQSIAESTLRSTGVEEDARLRFSERLLALSQAHNVLVKENWAGADLGTLVEDAVHLHRNDRHDRFHLEGPLVRVSAEQALSISLLLHELVTNAIKHGSLFATSGQVRVSWNLSLDGAGQRNLTLLWQEVDGPPVSQPTRHGFGSRLIERSFARETSGEALLHFDPEGLRCVVTICLSSKAERPGGLESLP